MIWNYRIIKIKGTFVICEVYYENGKPVGWAENCYPLGTNLKELQQDWGYMQLAFNKPILVVKKNKLKEKLLSELISTKE